MSAGKSVPAPPATTVIHRWVERCRAGDYPPVVCKLPAGWVVMGERQVFAGYCLLLPDPVVAQLNDLHHASRVRFLTDMSRIGDALLSATGASRINYAMFGNVEPALHAHVFPRRADEPAATRTAHPWAVDWSQAPEYAVASHGELQRRLAASLEA